MKFPYRLLPFLALGLTALPALAEPPTADGHTRDEETATIRQHHLKRLDDRLTQEAHVLREHCRYESEIPVRPPAKQVVLTFDDGPEPGQTEQILETLKRHGIMGTFFVIGQKAQQHPELIAQIRATGGHLVANHSWDHPNFHDIPPARQAEEVLKSDELLAAGQSAASAPKLFRYPYGNSSCDTNDLLRARGYKIVGWHVDSCDWAFDRMGSVDNREALSCGVLPQNRQDFVEHVVASVRAHDGGIVLLHEIHPNTLKKLDDIITRLKAEGFSFAALDAPEFASALR